MCVYAHVRAHIDTVPAELGMELQAVVSHSAWMLGAELRPFKREVYALHLGADSPDLKVQLLMNIFC